MVEIGSGYAPHRVADNSIIDPGVMATDFCKLADDSRRRVFIGRIGGGCVGCEVAVCDCDEPRVKGLSGVFIIDNADENVDGRFVAKSSVSDVQDLRCRLCVANLENNGGPGLAQNWLSEHERRRNRVQRIRPWIWTKTRIWLFLFAGNPDVYNISSQL